MKQSPGYRQFSPKNPIRQKIEYNNQKEGEKHRNINIYDCVKSCNDVPDSNFIDWIPNIEIKNRKLHTELYRRWSDLPSF